MPGPPSERMMCRFLLLIAGITLAFMLLFTLLDVIMRAFGRPIVGDYEVISFLGAVVFGFSIPYTSALKRTRDCRFTAGKAAQQSGRTQSRWPPGLSAWHFSSG